MQHVIGVVPAAGRGARMSPYRAPKELVEVGYCAGGEDGGGALIPKVAIEYVLQALRLAGVGTTYVVLSPAKWDVFRFLGPGTHLGMRLAYLCQEEPLGMPPALDLARPFVRDATVCMGMPDTIVQPADCFAQLLSFHRDHAADLSLGVFDTESPRTAAPVLIDPATARVLVIADKPAEPPAPNTWGIAVWSGAFTELLHDRVAAAAGTGPESLLSDVFTAAVDAGLVVRGLPFAGSGYHDIGTPENLIRTRARLQQSTRAAG